MNVLLLGSGGREHALAWKLSQSPLLDKLYIAPGNGGTSALGDNVDLALSDFPSIEHFVKTNNIEMIVCGPEQPLVEGIADYFSERDIKVVGPGKEGAKLEGSKAFSKVFMEANDIPTAAYGTFTGNQLQEALEFIEEMPTPIVLKADGLAAGKGVLILDSKNEAQRELKEMFEGKFGDASSTVVIEHFLSGIEFSVFALTDGKDYVILPVAKDYKRIGEGDTGLNTGGMGTVSPPPFVDQTLMDKVLTQIVDPTINGLQARQIDYKGFIFFGLISVNGDPYVIEYNCRLGDPETQVVLPRMQTDLLAAFNALFNGTLSQCNMISTDQTCVAVVMASGGYPGSYEKGKTMTLPGQLSDDKLIFHAGTKMADGNIVTSGGRVLAGCALGPDLRLARERAYELVDEIDFEKKYFRKDIGLDLMTHV